MSRLFVTNKEVQFINDTTKEFIKDVVGQAIIYYPISILKTKVHEVYDEAIQKIFENPIKLEVLAGQPQGSTSHNLFGAEYTTKFEVLVHARDLIDRGLTINEGDYFTYANSVFEIQSYINLNHIFGLEEYDCAFKIIGKLARPGTFDINQFLIGQDSKKFLESGAQKEFVQQRGLKETPDGQPTGDIRQVRERQGEDAVEPALGDGPRKIALDEEKETNSFYNE